MNNRIRQYENTREAASWWTRSVVLKFIWQEERPLPRTPFVVDQCQRMFENDVSPDAAASWLAKALNALKWQPVPGTN